MKQTKEYPATHSMDTAWYIADEDGNVGIVDFNESGHLQLCAVQRTAPVAGLRRLGGRAWKRC